ncbi:hypothetical protein [Nonomuraea rosea]|uniref:hypothetical protein n=1 Tax=Nonomuraea rosea TaxID=638574 RepID=UPI0031EF929F
MEQQFGSMAVELHVAELINLCGYPHRLIYADTAIMPRSMVARFIRVTELGLLEVGAAGLGIVAD